MRLAATMATAALLVSVLLLARGGHVAGEGARPSHEPTTFAHDGAVRCVRA